MSQSNQREKARKAVETAIKSFLVYTPIQSPHNRKSQISSEKKKELHELFKNAEPLPPLANNLRKRIAEEEHQKMARLVPHYLNQAFNKESCADFIKETLFTYKEQNSLKGFCALWGTTGGERSYTPLYEPLYFQNLKKVEVSDSFEDITAERRAIFSLLRIFQAISSQDIFNNSQARQTLLSDINHSEAKFYKAVSIEPCLIQTDIGIEALKKLSFYHISQSKFLGKALSDRPKNMKSDTLPENKAQIFTYKMNLLLIRILEPSVVYLTHEEISDLFKNNNLLSEEYSPEKYGEKVRNPIIGKKIKTPL